MYRCLLRANYLPVRWRVAVAAGSATARGEGRTLPTEFGPYFPNTGHYAVAQDDHDAIIVDCNAAKNAEFNSRCIGIVVSMRVSERNDFKETLSTTLRIDNTLMFRNDLAA